MFTANEITTNYEATINGITYIVLDDGCYANVYAADDVDLDAEYADYNEFCQAVDAVSDEAIIAEVCREAGIEGAYTPGSCCWVEAAKDVVDEDEDDAEPTMWDFELTELTITDADGDVLVNGLCCNNHDHLSRTAQEWADRLGKPVYITSDDDALNEEVEPSEAAEDAEDDGDELEGMTPAAAWETYVGSQSAAEFASLAAYRDQTIADACAHYAANAPSCGNLCDKARETLAWMLEQYIAQQAAVAAAR